MDETARNDLARLLAATKEAHSEVPDDGHRWVDWYAEYLESRVVPLLGREVDRGTLSRWLTDADEAHGREAPDTPWPEFYARFLIGVAGEGPFGP